MFRKSIPTQKAPNPSLKFSADGFGEILFENIRCFLLPVIFFSDNANDKTYRKSSG